MFGLQQPTSYSRLGLPQVLEYSSTHSSSNYSSNFFTTRLLAFIFPVANPHFRLTFLQPIDELLKFMKTRGFAISFVHLPTWKLIWIYTCRRGACSRPWPSGPRYADPPPVIRYWQLVLKYFRHKRVSSRKLLVSGSPTHGEYFDVTTDATKRFDRQQNHLINCHHNHARSHMLKTPSLWSRLSSAY